LQVFSYLASNVYRFLARVNAGPQAYRFLLQRLSDGTVLLFPGQQFHVLGLLFSQVLLGFKLYDLPGLPAQLPGNEYQKQGNNPRRVSTSTNAWWPP